MKAPAGAGALELRGFESSSVGLRSGVGLGVGRPRCGDGRRPSRSTGGFWGLFRRAAEAKHARLAERALEPGGAAAPVRPGLRSGPGPGAARDSGSGRRDPLPGGLLLLGFPLSGFALLLLALLDGALLGFLLLLLVAAASRCWASRCSLALLLRLFAPPASGRLHAVLLLLGGFSLLSLALLDRALLLLAFLLLGRFALLLSRWAASRCCTSRCCCCSLTLLELALLLLGSLALLDLALLLLGGFAAEPLGPQRRRAPGRRESGPRAPDARGPERSRRVRRRRTAPVGRGSRLRGDGPLARRQLAAAGSGHGLGLNRPGRLALRAPARRAPFRGPRACTGTGGLS